ncbi:hypothetical protein M5K25_001419 [Dendrobium thyrsiflorum]|uniref:Remorin C-terminal domain-containing protein n=1 Tax=Dendrobium thyrsiflorum TaxID=117978 RepID=A0ABD0VQX0_DENTH
MHGQWPHCNKQELGIHFITSNNAAIVAISSVSSGGPPSSSISDELRALLAYFGRNPSPNHRMDYERIEKPATPGGGFSPGKLRAMLLGVEKRRKDEEEELEARFSLRSDLGEAENRGTSLEENCKDVGIVSLNSRVSAPAENFPDSESVLSGFEFQKAERAQHHRPVLMPPFSKPAPSKWDDAQKWIASPMSNRQRGLAQLKKMGFMGHGVRQQASSAKVILEVSDEAETKRIDLNQEKKEMDGKRGLVWLPEPYTEVDLDMKDAPMLEDYAPDSTISLSQHDTSASTHNDTSYIMPPTIVKAISMRDMGTEMTPIASQEPSQTGTPVRATTPTRSPTYSRTSTPKRTASSSIPIDPVDSSGDKEITEKQLRLKTRKEIMVLGTQLGKMNIAAWASKEDEATNSSVSLKTDQPPKNMIDTRAVAWEEAEKAKYIARFKREEIKIQAWENHQKAKTEAEMRKVEVEVEKMRAWAHDKLMNKLAAARHKAEEKRAEAEAHRNQQAARTAQEAEYIRRTGRIPSSFSCWV